METAGRGFAVGSEENTQVNVPQRTPEKIVAGVPPDGGLHTVGHSTHAVHHLIRDENGIIQGSGQAGFCPDGYSRFKHGDENWTRLYGHQVADMLLAELGGLFDEIASDEVILASFPYKYVPTAAANLVDHTLTRLNHVLSTSGRPAAGLMHAFKYPWQASIEHYFPTMDVESRRDTLGNIRLSVDESRLQGAHLVVVDDVRVTGSTEDMFLRFLYEIPGLKSLTVVFLAEVAPDVAADAAVEYEINHHEITTLDDVAGIISGGAFRWNVRVAKFVLEHEDLDEFSDFLNVLSDHRLTELYRAAMLNEYHLEVKYLGHMKVMGEEMEHRLLV